MSAATFGAGFRAERILSLTTDFGIVDGYVGTMKGVALGVDAALRLVDLLHVVRPQNVREGAFHLRHAWRHFPEGSVHLAVVDPGVGTSRRSVVAVAAGQLFMAPDNGLLPACLAGQPDVQYGVLDAARFLRAGASSTFHARDLYAPAAAALASGQCRPSAAIERTVEVDGLVRLDGEQPEWLADGTLVGSVVHCDNFGNVITNLDAQDPRVAARISAGATVQIAERSPRWVTTYGEAQPGDLVVLVDSFGLIEVAVAGGNAEADLHVDVGDSVRLSPYGTVRPG